MRNDKNKFELADLQVPFDSTWVIKDTIVIGEKKDTTWIKTAEKLFAGVDEINKSYLSYKGANKKITRRSSFEKKFKWFNTVFRFSESIDRKMSSGYPLSDFLASDELTFFYSPESIAGEKMKGADSIKYKAMKDTINIKVDKWAFNCVVSGWIDEFSKLTEGKTASGISKVTLKAKEDLLVRLIKQNEDKFDSVWATGTILRDFIGEENSVKFKTEADSAMSVVTNQFLVDFKDYSVRIVMPGKVIGTNGFIDKDEMLLWPVKSDYFLTEPYEMWAESKVINIWAWAVTGAFILFVIVGLLIRLFRK
jgi:hypothetical protein